MRASQPDRRRPRAVPLFATCSKHRDRAIIARHIEVVSLGDGTDIVDGRRGR